MVVSQKLFEDLVQLFEDMNDLDMLNSTVSCRGDVLGCTNILSSNEPKDPGSTDTAKT